RQAVDRRGLEGPVRVAAETIRAQALHGDQQDAGMRGGLRRSRRGRASPRRGRSGEGAERRGREKSAFHFSSTWIDRDGSGRLPPSWLRRVVKKSTSLSSYSLRSAA